jgi:hypothetical protein
MTRSEKTIRTRLKWLAMEHNCSIEQLAKLPDDELFEPMLQGRVSNLGEKSIRYLRALGAPKPLEFWL